MHPAVVISVITLGAALFGLVGAFLSVPVLAVLNVIARYVREHLQTPTRTVEPDPPDDRPRATDQPAGDGPSGGSGGEVANQDRSRFGQTPR